jgi:hypothetical protein
MDDPNIPRLGEQGCSQECAGVIPENKHVDLCGWLRHKCDKQSYPDGLPFRKAKLNTPSSSKTRLCIFLLSGGTRVALSHDVSLNALALWAKESVMVRMVIVLSLGLISLTALAGCHASGSVGSDAHISAPR